MLSAALMASIEKAEPVSSESSLDGPHTTSGGPSHSRAPSPALNSDQQSNSIQEHAPTPAPPPPAPTSSPFAIPHPKRFNSVNINKKFLQKNSSSSAVAVVASLTTAAKSGSPTPRPAPQPSASHSKLVTAKLTSTAQLSATAGPGWSRPSSATPPVSTTPSGSSNAPPPQPTAPTPAAPQFPHVGKVIQPQPRNAFASSSPLVKKDSPTKSAWGNAKSLPVPSDSAPCSDFPTAAEVAQGRLVKTEEQKPDDPPAPGPVPSQDADAFRGVHLDPNAHHWDEMEEDDDNFLDNVIEFGDGRQYKVAPQPTGQPLPGSTTATTEEASVSAADHVSAEPVSKEERFADDFDRSWPRARQSPLVFQRDLPSRSSQPISVSPTPSQPSHSSAEGSRVLFNERSNRLEPYTNPNFPNRVGPGHGLSRRNAHGEAEPRFGKDPLHRSPVYPVHLLQKPSEGTHDILVQSPRSYTGDFVGRRMERDNGPYSPGGDFGQNRVRSRDSGGPSGPFHDLRGISEKRNRRLSGASFASSVPDGQQQGSTYSSDGPFSRRSHPRESPLQHLSVLPANASAQAPRLSQLPATSHTDTSDAQLLGNSPVLDIEGVHKTAMHLSAERAKRRRQLEEEEREKEKERARKKAAELEARMVEAQKAAAVEVFLQQVITSAQTSNQLVSDLEKHKSPGAISANEHSPALKSVSRPQREIQDSRPTLIEPLPPMEQVDSWRSKTRAQPQQLPALSLPVFEDPSGVVTDDNLEVIDFSDLGKFVGNEQASLASGTPAPSSHSPASSDRHSFPGRPVASDFFEDGPFHAFAAKIITSPSSERYTLPIVPEASVLPSGEEAEPLMPTVATHGTREHESHRFSATNGVHPVGRSQPSPIVPHHRLSKGPPPFRQVRMSALDDVMSRIKGALDDMHVDAGREPSSNEHADWRTSVAKPKVRVMESPILTRTLSKDAKWLPPALRQPQQDLVEEVFGATGCDPACSPPVALVVNLPTISRPADTVPKRQLNLLKHSTNHLRLDTLSWDSSVDGMNKRDLTVNDILHKRPPLGKGNKPRYRVQLPRAARTHSASLPKVNLPSGFPKVNTTSGRSKAVDDLTTWRRGPVSSTTARKPILAEETPPTLDVTSCSPAPELAVSSSKPTVEPEVSTKSEPYLVRQRTQPKLPTGSAVGFYRDPGSSFQDAKATVKFTVTSELEKAMQVPQPESSMLLSSSIVETPSAAAPLKPKGSAAVASPSVDETNYGLQLPTLSLADSKVSEESTERSLRTPASASFSTPWTKSPLSFASKDSPARPPDPEHLRAVWSQTAGKEPMSAINSLEGIADDLTALPFTIQEVKSEDGETPPPTSAAVASKISLHDVTRAFQQVPTSSNLSSHRPPPLSPTTVNGPSTRPPSFTYHAPPQAPGTAIRHFAAFPSPMLAHSPSPTVLYPPTAPSPIPRVPMNGHPQMYNQPMWVHMQTPQNNSTIRPIHSPYPTQMVAYPAPAPVHPVYASGLSPQNVPPSVTGSAPPRPRGMPMLSPVMHAAAPANVPMYNGSPVLMHPPAMIAPGPRPPYVNSGPPDRGQSRSEAMSAAPHMQQPSHSQNHIPPQPVYTHVPFSRPSW